MNKKNSSSKLPKWFDFKKYEKTRQFKPKDWYRELSFRLYMQNALKTIQNQNDEFLSLKFKKSVLFCFRELALNPIDTSKASKRINDYFENILKHYRANNEWSHGSTLSLYQSTLSSNRIRTPEDVDKFLSNNDLILPLHLKKPIDLLEPHGLRALNKIYNKRKSEWCSAMYSELNKSDPNTDVGLIPDVLSDSLKNLSITSFIKKELEFNDPEGKLEKELYIAGIKTTDLIMVVDPLHDEKRLVAQFKETIKKEKAKRPIPEEVLKVTDNKLRKLSNYKVLPYIDLFFWGEFTEPFNEGFLDGEFFPNEEHTVEISKKYMEEALSISFLHSLNII